MRQSKAILIIDDSPKDAEILRVLLEEAGITNPVHIVRNGAEAIGHLERIAALNGHADAPAPGIVFVDLKMPGIDGLRFLEWLRPRPELQDLLVIVLSGQEESQSVRRAFSLGVNSFLPKPCRPIDLENLIHAFPLHWERGS